MNKKIIFSFVMIFFLIGIVSAATSYCCEKTTSGAWCQNDEETNCDSAFQKAPTRCDSTDYCKLGCCYNSDQGTCMQNTPQRICEESNGTWNDKVDCTIPQCSLGCCQLGSTQAVLVTRTRCNRLSALYGISNVFKSNIKTEFECISTAISQELGACVFEKDYERTCSILTREDCNKLKSQDTNIEFYQGHLCSDENLSTNCAPSDETTCVEGKDQVYYLDTCGNLANIYDFARRNNKNYWAFMKDQQDSCSSNQSNANSPSCGNCDYLLGSTCKEYDSGIDTHAPDIGDNICRDLSCMYDNDGDGQKERYEHGETWCATYGGVSEILVNNLTDVFERLQTNVGENPPGSRYIRLLCYNGEVSIEPCADYRKEICIQSNVNGFRNAICRVNRWQDCIAQTGSEACSDQQNRDCQWVNDKCIPLFAPGFEFWDSEEDAADICNLGNDYCVVTYKKDLGGSWEPDDNEHCLKDGWLNDRNSFCTSIGDCGSSVNYVNIAGYYNPADLKWVSGKLENEGEIEDTLGGAFS